VKPSPSRTVRFVAAAIATLVLAAGCTSADAPEGEDSASAEELGFRFDGPDEGTLVNAGGPRGAGLHGHGGER
jgi:hypothetical protein